MTPMKPLACRTHCGHTMKVSPSQLRHLTGGPGWIVSAPKGLEKSNPPPPQTLTFLGGGSGRR